MDALKKFITDTLEVSDGVRIETLVVLLSFGIVGLAAYAIYAVLTLAKREKE